MRLLSFLKVTRSFGDAVASVTTTTATISLLLFVPVVVDGFSATIPPRQSNNSNRFSNNKIPEDVVQSQLRALQEYNIVSAFDYNSPNNQEVTGPWQSFATSLAESPFRPILGHAESSVLMTVSHDDADCVCCLVKIVPAVANNGGRQQLQKLPESLAKTIAEYREMEGLDDDEDEDEEDDDDEDEDDDDEEDSQIEFENSSSDSRKELPCALYYWWEVSQQFNDNDDEDRGENDNDDYDDYFYSVDSILPEAEDLELDYMETTLFAIGDGDDDEYGDEDDDPSDYFFDLGL